MSVLWMPDREPDFAQEFAEATRKTFEPVTPCGSRERAAGWWWLVAGVVTATVFIAAAIRFSK